MMARLARARTRGWLAGTTATLALLGLPQAAGAQTSEASGLTFDDPAPRLILSAALETRYDSNVPRVSDDAELRSGLHKSDVLIAPSVNVDLVAPTSIAKLTLRGSAGYDFFVRNSRLNRERIDLAGTAGRRLAVCDVSLSAAINRRQTDLGDLAVIVDGDGNGDGTVNVESQWRVGASAACGPPVGIQPTGYVSYRQLRNSAQVRKANDADVLDFGGGITYSSPAFGKLAVFAGRSEFDYSRRGPGQPFAGAERFDLTYAGARLDRRLGARLQAQAQVTYVKVSAPGSGFDRFDGINWDIAAQLRLGGSTLVSLGTSRTIDVAAGFQSNFVRTTAANLRVERALSPVTRIAIAAARRKRDFSGIAVPTGTIVADDRTDQLRASVIRDTQRALRFQLYAQYQKRTSELAILNYDSVQIGLITTLRF